MALGSWATLLWVVGPLDNSEMGAPVAIIISGRKRLVPGFLCAKVSARLHLRWLWA